MDHVLLGAVFPFLGAAALYVFRGGRASLKMLLATPVLMGAAGLWAAFPDLPRLVGRYTLYWRWALDPRMDLFFWHYTVDQLEAYTPWTAAAWVAIAAGMIAVAWRELRLREEC